MTKDKSSTPINYHLRLAKNIERKMMGEVFARMRPIAELSSYQYIGFGSEFFNDFALYHQVLGISDMTSIERDSHRIDRCKFNRPYGCIKVLEGVANQVLPTLSWKRRAILWLDYTEKLDKLILKDVELVISQAISGSILVWSVNAEPWGKIDDVTQENIAVSEIPAKRKQKLRELFLPKPVPTELTSRNLSNWGLAEVFYSVLSTNIQRVLADRNASAKASEKLSFKQCFHFRYADGVKMLTVGGVLLNKIDSERLGESPFSGLKFVRENEEAFEIKPPLLTGREVRLLNRLLPNDVENGEIPRWLSESDVDRFREVYRYYPVFAESEL